MRIAYVVNTRIPTDKAHGYQIVRVCSELARLGHEVVLYTPSRANSITEDAFTYYGIGQNFRIERVPCFDAMRFVGFLGPLAFWLTMLSFLKHLELSTDELVYTRDADAVAYLSKRGFRCVYNAHNWAESRTARVKVALGIVANSQATAEAVQKTGLPTIVAPNGTDLNKYVGQDKAILRKDLGLPEGKLAVYAGHLQKWKGSSEIEAAAAQLKNINFVVIGDTGKDTENLKFLGHKPQAQVAKYLAAADVLLLPNIPEGESKFTSPLKMFEYMASGNPIVAYEIPSILEILTPETAVLVPFKPNSIAAGVDLAFAQGFQKAQKALIESRKYTWSAHAEKVSEFIKAVNRVSV